MRFSTSLALALALTGCFGEERQDPSYAAPYDEGGHCDYDHSTFGIDETTPLGFTGAELAAELAGPRSEILSWDETGDTTTLALELSFADDAEVTYVWGEWVDPDSGGMADTGGQDCAEYVYVEATMSFVTTDGLMNESLDVRVEADGATLGRVEKTVEHEDLVGSYTPSDTEAFENAVNTEIEFVASVTATATHGELALRMNGYDEDDSSVAWSSQGDIARWPPNE